MTTEQFKRLLTGYQTGALSPEEQQELIDLLHSVRRDPELQGLFPETLDGLDNLAAPETLGLIYQRVLEQNRIEREEPLIHRIRRPFRARLAVAASVLLVVSGIGTWYLVFEKQNQNQPAVTARINDVKAPAGSRATITLGNGQVLNLDSAADGQLALQGNAHLLKAADGRLIYHTGEARNDAVIYNTLSNPRGSRVIDITLSDGTRVWLNSESSIRYPAAFREADRTVEMTGEAYFEVARDQRKPFQIMAHGMTVDVLGTHFNVNAYADEDALKATLIQGKIRVGTGAGPGVLLNPGQQASVTRGGAPVGIDKDPDIEQVMAWKNGAFAFTHADLPSVMRQLSRWYNVEVAYQGAIPSRDFSGEIGRSLTLSQLLDGLTASRIHYKIVNENKIVILSDP